MLHVAHLCEPGRTGSAPRRRRLRHVLRLLVRGVRVLETRRRRIPRTLLLPRIRRLSISTARWRGLLVRRRRRARGLWHGYNRRRHRGLRGTAAALAGPRRQPRSDHVLGLWEGVRIAQRCRLGAESRISAAVSSNRRSPRRCKGRLRRELLTAVVCVFVCRSRGICVSRRFGLRDRRGSMSTSRRLRLWVPRFACLSRLWVPKRISGLRGIGIGFLWLVRGQVVIAFLLPPVSGASSCSIGGGLLLRRRCLVAGGRHSIAPPRICCDSRSRLQRAGVDAVAGP